jgi:hypothetical protein
VTLFTPDQTWKVQISSYKTNLFFYNAIGTSVDVWHLEQVPGNIWGGAHTDWVARPAIEIVITNMYRGGVVGTAIGTQRQSQSNVSHSELKIWNFGLSLSWDATASPGGPASESNLPGAAPNLEVRSVTGDVSVVVPGKAPLAGTTTAP